MFLNWVYRYNVDPENSDSFAAGCTDTDASQVGIQLGLTPNHWQTDPENPDIAGFLNYTWEDITGVESTLGNPDAELSGDARYVRTHRYIRELIIEGGY